MFALAAVRLNPQFRKTTDAAIDAVVREWLRTASDRDGGRKKRYQKCASSQSLRESLPDDVE